jgi:hypothetical protein
LECLIAQTVAGLRLTFLGNRSKTMTVKELKEILDGCNDDAIVSIHWETDSAFQFDNLHDSQVFNDAEQNQVVFDITYGDEK